MLTSRISRTMALLFVLGTSMGWSPSAQPAISRKVLLDGLATAVIGNMVLASPANADVTSKLASASAIKNVKRSQKQLESLLPVAQANDFLGVKSFLRTPPLDEVRKPTFLLVRGGEDGPKADELQAAYKAFIASIEKIDGTASLGARGRKIDPFQMSEECQVVESTMKDFLKVAEEAAGIPIQYAE
jgi:hypothetical protein